MTILTCVFILKLLIVSFSILSSQYTWFDKQTFAIVLLGRFIINKINECSTEVEVTGVVKNNFKFMVTFVIFCFV